MSVVRFAGCGGTYQIQRTEQTVLLMSPGYPVNYDNKLRCNYTITGPPEHYLAIRFNPDSYALEGK
jgi:hypothetical protein